MFDGIFKSLAKKYVVKMLNKLLLDVKDNQKVTYWRNKVVIITKFLTNLQEYLSDNEISDEEVDKICEECKDLF